MMVAMKYNIERKLTYVNVSKLFYDNINHKSTTTAKVSCTISGHYYDERQNKPDGLELLNCADNFQYS